MPASARGRARTVVQAFVLSAFLVVAFPVVTGASSIAATTSSRLESAPAPPAGSGRFVLPVTGPAVISTPFRPPASRYGPGHRGVDLAWPTGRPVLASGAGVVVFAGLLAGRRVVSIQHAAGLRTSYEPVTSMLQAGDRVIAGQQIGKLEAGHGSCAPASCLHWGARLPDKTYVDPMGLLTGLRVRLLPWVR